MCVLAYVVDCNPVLSTLVQRSVSLTVIKNNCLTGRVVPAAIPIAGFSLEGAV